MVAIKKFIRPILTIFALILISGLPVFGDSGFILPPTTSGSGGVSVDLGTTIGDVLQLTGSSTIGTATNIPATSFTIPYANLGVAQDVYVATTGNDSNSCRTTLLPCLTIGRALDLMAQNSITGGYWVLHIADGTYTQSTQLFLPNLIGRKSDQIYGNSHVHILGNQAHPENVIISNHVTSTIFRGRFNGDMSYLIEGVTVSGTGALASIAFRPEGGNFFLKDIIYDHVGFAVSSSNKNSYVSMSGSHTGIAQNGIVIQNGSAVDISGTISFTGITSTGIDARFGSYLNMGVGSSLSLVGDAALGGNIGISARDDSHVFIRGSGLNIQDFTTDTVTSAATALYVDRHSQIRVQAATVITADNCTNPGIFKNSGMYLENSGGTTTWNFTNGTPNVFKVDATSWVSPNNLFSGGTVSLLDPATGEVYGSDLRYKKVLSFNVPGALPLGTTAYFTSAGLSSTLTPLYIALANEKVSLNVICDANGASHTDTYTVFVGGSISATAATITNSTAGASSTKTNLTAGTTLGLQVVTDAATTGGNCMGQLTVEQR